MRKSNKDITWATLWHWEWRPKCEFVERIH